MRDACSAYRLLMPPAGAGGCAVFSSPHSGRDYPPELLRQTRLNRLQLRLSEDAFVDELFADAPDHGAPLIAAIMPRAYVDLNRAPGELDPKLIEGVADPAPNPRVAAGLGVVPRVVAEGMAIYPGRIDAAEARRRIACFHAPYHAALERLLGDARDRHGLAVLFDCHSMPSDAARAALPGGRNSADIVLGDRHGASAAAWVTDAVQRAFEEAGFIVARNAPFAGGYITQRFGRPAAGWHAVQIEIDRGLYLDEARIERGAGFEVTRRRIAAVVAGLARIGRAPSRLAAE